MKKRWLLTAAILALALTGCQGAVSSQADETELQSETAATESEDAGSNVETEAVSIAETSDISVQDTDEAINNEDLLTVNGGTQIQLSSLKHRTEM